jgi:hypothetical protein
LCSPRRWSSDLRSPLSSSPLQLEHDAPAAGTRAVWMIEQSHQSTAAWHTLALAERIADVLPPLAAERGLPPLLCLRSSLLSPQCLSRNALAGSSILAAAIGADALAAGMEQCAAAGRALVATTVQYALHRHHHCRRCRRTLIKPPANRDSCWPHAQAGITQVAQQSEEWLVGHPGYAARTRLEHERGGNLFLKEKKKINPKTCNNGSAVEDTR